MRASLPLCIAGLIAAVLGASCAAQPAEHSAPSVHAQEFWESIAKSEFALPPGEDALALTLELGALFASRDPHVRDELGYEIAAAWIYRQRLLSADELRQVQDSWSANLRVGIGEQGTDSVLRRSFSALGLSLIAARDVAQPCLSPSDFERLLDAALEYSREERDLRGWQWDVGWIHSCAHTADLLKFLARNRTLTAQGEQRILAGIQAKLTAPSEHAYDFGEDERLARAVVSIVARADFDPAAFEAFLARSAEACVRSRDARPFDPVLFAGEQNTKHCLRALYAILAADPEPRPDIAAARDALLATLSAL